MNSKLKYLLVIALLLPVLVFALALAEDEFQLLTRSWQYSGHYGRFAFFTILMVVFLATFFAIVNYRRKYIASYGIALLLAVLAVVGLCLPDQARAIQSYYSHEQLQARFVSRLNDRLNEDPRFSNVRLSYSYGKGEHCTVRGTVSTDDDLDALGTILSSELALFTWNEVTSNEPVAD